MQRFGGLQGLLELLVETTRTPSGNLKFKASRHSNTWSISMYLWETYSPTVCYFSRIWGKMLLSVTGPFFRCFWEPHMFWDIETAEGGVCGSPRHELLDAPHGRLVDFLTDVAWWLWAAISQKGKPEDGSINSLWAKVTICPKNYDHRWVMSMLTVGPGWGSSMWMCHTASSAAVVVLYCWFRVRNCTDFGWLWHKHGSWMDSIYFSWVSFVVWRNAIGQFF